MYPFRLNQFRRVHKPILFLVLCFLFLLGIVGSTRFDADTNTTPIPTVSQTQGQQNVQLESNVKTMSGSSQPGVAGTGSDDILIVTSHEDFDLRVGSENIFDENLIPVPVVPKQLPFCKTATTTTTTPTSTTGNNGEEDENENDSGEDYEDGNSSNETSDKVVLSNPNGLKAGKLIVVATLDGKLSVLDHGGRIIWSIGTGHFFSSTISTIQLSENGRYVKMIPSLSGGLYKYDGKSLEAMPLNAELLLKRSFKLTNDVVITGGKELRTFGVDLESGSLKYECGMEGCHRSSDAELKPNDDPNRVVLVVKKQLQTVRAVESLTGSERWNFSVATHELALAGVEEGCLQQPVDEPVDYESTKYLFKMLIPEGIVFGADAENQVVWQHKFDSPISQAWTLEKGRLQVVDPIRAAPRVDDIPSLYVGIHKQQLYVQESHAAALRLKAKLELDFVGEGQNGFTQKTIEWKPSGMRLPQPGQDNENTALASLYDGGPFFVYDRDEIPQIPAIEAPPNSSNIEDPFLGEVDEDDALIMLGLTTLWFWWKEVLGISLLTAVLLNILLMRPLMRFVRRETVTEMTRYFGNMINRERQNQLAILPRVSSSEESLENERQRERERLRSVSTSSSHSASGISGEDQTPFNSQYLREFEPIQCLGRGGFGVVFEARKRIDDRSYAVKRIALPNSEKSRDRVMREVKSLAKLDHRNIVRYFNAWIEHPPTGWLEKNDPLWNCGALSSPSPTCDYPSESIIGSGAGDSWSVAHSVGQRKKDHLEISVPDKTPCDDDDSFIVFTTHSIDEVDEDEESDPGQNRQYAELRNRSVSVSIDRVSCDSENNSLSNPNAQEDSISSNGKFFNRPTTLNIPSSSDSNPWDQDPDTNSSRSRDETGLIIAKSQSVMFLYIQQELCQKRTLQEWLRAEKQRNLRQVVRIFAQIVEAVEYIHSHNLIHRDLKPSNIFLAGETGREEESTMTAKIGDFGLATTLVPNKLNEEAQNPTSEGDGNSTPDYANLKLTGHVGTHLYMSPEQNQQKPYDYKVDIYSLGLIFFELLVPFSTEMERYDFLSRVRKLNFPNLFADSHPEEYKLIKQMVSHRPNKRPDTPEIKLWLKERIDSLQFTNSTTIPTLRSKSFPSPKFVDEAVAKNKAGEKQLKSKQFYKAHSFHH